MPSKNTASLSKRDRNLLSSEDHDGPEETRQLDDCLRVIGDRHAMLILRELSMNVCRFQDIQLQTKISPYILSSRLRRLEKDGIIEKKKYSAKPPRYEYIRTPKGKGLDEFLFAAGNWDVLWGNSGKGHEPSLTVYDKKTGTRLGPKPRSRRRSTGKNSENAKQTPP